MLPDVSPVYEEEVIFSAVNSSTTVNSKECYRKMTKQESPFWNFSQDPLKGIRARVPVGPAGYRDTVILPIEQTNSVRLIEKQCHLIVEKLQYSAHYSDPVRFEKKLERFRAKYLYFFDRDIKKEGITKPHELTKATLEVLAEKYPNYPAWKYSNIYDGYTLFADGEWHSFKRGYGLGMANSLTTIIQCAIFKYTLKYYVENYEQCGDISAMFLNDDCEIGIENENDLADFIDVDDEILTRFQIIRSNKKSTYGRSTVFCEVYYEEGVDLSDKQSYKLNEIYQTFAQQNITAAKGLVSNLSSQILVSDIRDYLKDIVSFWGYEFYPGEYERPYSLGGWISPTLMGVKLDALYCDQVLTKEEYQAWLTISQVSHPRKWLRKIDKNLPFYDPLFILYGELNLPEKDKAKFNHMQTFRSVMEKFYKPKTDREDGMILSNFKKARRRQFENCRWQGIRKRAVFYQELVEFYSEKDVMPPIDCITGYESYPDLEIPRPRYKNANPLMSYIKYYNMDLFNEVIPERYSYRNTSIKKKMTAEERRAIFKYTELFRGNEIFVSDIALYDDFYIRSPWRNNGNVLTAFCNLSAHVKIPLTDQEDNVTDLEIHMLNALSGPHGPYIEKFYRRFGLVVFEPGVLEDLQVHIANTFPKEEPFDEDEYQYVLGSYRKVQAGEIPEYLTRKRNLFDSLERSGTQRVELPSGEIRIEVDAYDFLFPEMDEMSQEETIIENPEEEIDIEEQNSESEEEILETQEVEEDEIEALQRRLRSQFLSRQPIEEEIIEEVADQSEEDESEEEDLLDIVDQVPITEINLSDHGICGFRDFATWHFQSDLPVHPELEPFFRELSVMFFNLTNSIGYTRQQFIDGVPQSQLMGHANWEEFKFILEQSNAEFDDQGRPTGHWEGANLFDDSSGEEAEGDTLFDGLW